MAWFILLALLFLAFSFLYLRGENLAYLDTNIIPQPEGEPSEGHHEVVASLGDMISVVTRGSHKERIRALRDYMDSMSDGRE